MRRALPILALFAGCVAMWFLPGPRTLADAGGATSRAEVVETDDSQLQKHGLIEFGTQYLNVRLADGSVKKAHNELRAQLELDKKFKVGDTALVVLGDEPLVARDHWRLGWMGVLFGAFCLLLVAFGGWTGAKALFSFVFSCFAVWKLLIPLCLNGWNAGWTSLVCVTVLTAVIMYLVAGATRKGAAAFFGAMLGVGASLALADFFAAVLHVNGATMPFVQTLLYSGYGDLRLADVFTGSVILASSGAVMDLAMDISSACEEIVRHRPAITRRALFGSGLRVGRSVVGTMTTTLLLAYSGGYLTLLMVFAAQGTPPMDFVNATLVSAEIVKTLVGSFGLVLVAPFTAVVSAVLFVRRDGPRDRGACRPAAERQTSSSRS